MMWGGERTPEIERRLEEALDYIDWLKSELARLAQLLNQLGGGYPQSGGSGTFMVGKANGAISARSGTTPGSGTVDIYDASSGTLTDTGDDLSVKNLGAAIATGKYVGVEKDKYGVWWVAPQEC